MKRTTSSIHRINADKGLSKFKKFLWIFLNMLNNIYFPNRFKSDLCIKHFCPKMDEADWTRIDNKSTPPRALSDLFWLKIDWKKIKSELNSIHIFDIGCGSGNYALKLMDFSGGLISSYFGVDAEPKGSWADMMREHSFITLKKQDSGKILPYIPKETNLFITQSAIEHFEDDLTFFEQLHEFITKTLNNTIQIHLFPSAVCLRLYRLHGVRQYTPRTISKISGIFDSNHSYSLLFKLGGPNCNKLHIRSITKPYRIMKKDWRDTKPTEYKKLLIEAIDQDFENANNYPSFYALIIHSNFKDKIFENMKSLILRSYQILQAF